jgi:SAM-dependent methyltransferase
MRPFWVHAEIAADACGNCGHIVAHHAANAQAQARDYHLGYEQDDFVAALGATRRRQAGRIMDALRSLPSPPQSLFDFGCGRGWLLEVAQERGMRALAGGDVSDLALKQLATRGIPALRLDIQWPFEQLDVEALPFTPEAITLLDVIEHFSGDIATRLRAWIAGLPPRVRTIVIKVPMRDGLLFSLANAAQHAGVQSLMLQLFQVGTYPPHYQYFSRRSLSALLRKIGLSSVVVLDDLDFEPAELGKRMAAQGSALRPLASMAGHALGLAARAGRRADSRIVIATRAAA